MNITCDTDRFVTEVVNGGEYDFLFRDLVVLDVGCNIGTFSLLISPLSKRVYSVDIAGLNIDNFNQTIKNNSIENINTYLCAIAGTTGRRFIDLDPIPGSGGSKLSTVSNVGIQSYTVFDFMKKEKIDYIDVMKIDVEGGEMEILMEENFPSERISTILGEFHFADEELNRFKERIKELGYRFTEYPKNHFLARR